MIKKAKGSNNELEKLTKIGKAHAEKIGIKSEDDVVRRIHEGRRK